MGKTHKQLIIEHDNQPTMSLEIIDDAGNITEVKARAINIKNKLSKDILIAALPENVDGKFSVIVSADPSDAVTGRLVVYHSSANIMDVGLKLTKQKPKYTQRGDIGGPGRT